MLKMIKYSFSILFASVLFFACGSDENTDKSGAPKLEKLVVGATPIPHGELLELVKSDLKDSGIDLEVVIFNDYVQPNKGLEDKSLDANFFQHVPFMQDYAKRNGVDIIAVGKVHLEPMAMYSKKVKYLKDLPLGASVLVPNDPADLDRALLLLHKAELLQLKDTSTFSATLEDVVANPKNLKITPLAADQIAMRLAEVDAAFINANYALDAKLPLQEAILVEDINSPYANVLSVLKGNEKYPRVQKLLKALQSEKVKKFIDEKYHGSVIHTP